MHKTQLPEDLPTSRGQAEQETGVLAIIRALAPRRRMTRLETEYIAELQANRLLELAGRPQMPVPNELITELPRIRVLSDPDLPASGSARWAAGHWLISINSSEPHTRRRFSLAHELKHVIDHRHVDMIYGSEEQAEFAADCFAAALLMPKREVKRAYGEQQSLVALAGLFEVSPLAMARRLQHLGLRDQLPPRSRPHADRPKRRGTYYRAATPVRDLEVALS